ncbi:MAG: SRPBCC domain-containing protein [Balneolaceae bacterium]|nr:SRPBCC domain-containing protein [Balneolaceae bacterium]
MKSNKLEVKIDDNVLTMTRSFKASPKLLFEVWSSCEHLKHWWGPKEWPMAECEMDFREGGTWRYCLRGPNEEDQSWGKTIYQKIDKPNKIEYKDYFTDPEGNVLSNMPELDNSVEFIPQDGGTTTALMTTTFENNDQLTSILEMGMEEGLNSSMDRLDEYLAEIPTSV